MTVVPPGKKAYPYHAHLVNDQTLDCFRRNEEHYMATDNLWRNLACRPAMTGGGKTAG